MEGNPNNQNNIEKREFKESPEEFKKRIDYLFNSFFKEDGFDLSKFPKKVSPEEIRIYKSRRDEETDKRGVTLEQKIMFRIELAYFYILLSEREHCANLAWEELDDAHTMAFNANLEELEQKIENLINHLLSS